MKLFQKFIEKKDSSKSIDKDHATVNVSFEAISSFDNCIPPLQGDYAKTIFLWIHDKASPIRNDDEYSRYIKYECGIANPSKYHQFLVEEGYFTSASAHSMLSTMNVAELKKVLLNFGKPVSGKKDILISRIIDSLTQDSIDELFEQKMYELSDRGRAFLVEHNNYILLHKHNRWGIDWIEFDEAHIPGCSFYDTAWRILNERAVRDPYSCGRVQFYCMYELLKEEGRRQRAIEMLLKVFYIDVSGSGSMNIWMLFKDGTFDKDYLYDCFQSVIMLAPGIISEIEQYKDLFDDSIVERLYDWKLPIQVCDKDLFLEIVHLIMDGDFKLKDAEEKLRCAYIEFIRCLQ